MNNECHNYDWFVGWLSRNLIKPEKPTLNTSADYIAKNFSRSFFNVSEADAESALKHLRFDYAEIDGKLFFSIDRSSPAFKTFAKFWN